jgi:hypothetical protein
MADKMHEWITTGERLLPHFVMPFAKSASGSSKSEEGDDDDDDDNDDDDDDDDDPDADKSDDELRDELKRTRAALSKANGQSAKRRKALRERERELEEARKPKPKKSGKADDDDDGPDLDTIRHEARAEGSKEGIARAKKAEAKAALLGAGVNPARVVKAVGLLDLDDLDLDDDGLDGVDDAIEDLRKEWPELFAKKRVKRDSVAGERDRDGERESRRGKAKTASELAAAKLLGRG